MAVQMKGRIVKGNMVEVNRSEVLELGRDERKEAADLEVENLV